MARLGVNIDHIATLREARKGVEPDPFLSLPILASLNVDQVTLHLREDRRHIQEHDLARITQSKILPVNLEMAATPDMVLLALRYKPKTATLVPEKRLEITTEGGLDLTKKTNEIQKVISFLKAEDICVSLFIDPDKKQIKLAKDLGANAIEIHTGAYANAFGRENEKEEWARIDEAVKSASGLEVYAGHGLNVSNLPSLVSMKQIEEYNIGHSIMARALFVGLRQAIAEIQTVLR